MLRKQSIYTYCSPRQAHTLLSCGPLPHSIFFYIEIHVCVFDYYLLQTLLSIVWEMFIKNPMIVNIFFCMSLYRLDITWISEDIVTPVCAVCVTSVIYVNLSTVCRMLTFCISAPWLCDITPYVLSCVGKRSLRTPWLCDITHVYCVCDFCHIFWL